MITTGIDCRSKNTKVVIMIDNALLIDFIQKQQVSSAIAISLLRKKGVLDKKYAKNKFRKLRFYYLKISH